MHRFLQFGTSIIVDAAMLHILVKVFGFHPYVANFYAFVVAVLHNIILSRASGMKFDLPWIIGLSINMPAFIFVDTVMNPFWSRILFNPHQAFEAGYRFAKLCAIVVVLVWNFVVNRYWMPWSEKEL